MPRKKKESSPIDNQKEVKDLQAKVDELKEEKQQLQKEIDSNKTKSKRIGLAIGITTVILVIASIIVPITIMVVNNNKPKIITYLFKNSDINYLRTNLQLEIVNNHLNIDLFNLHMLNYFKAYLKASNIDISNLIQGVEIVSESLKYIEFKVILNSNNNEFLYEGNDSDIKLNENILIIIFQGSIAIEFE